MSKAETEGGGAAGVDWRREARIKKRKKKRKTEKSEKNERRPQRRGSLKKSNERYEEKKSKTLKE